MGLKSKKLQRFMRKRGPHKDRSDGSLEVLSTTGTRNQQLRVRLRKKTKPEDIPTGAAQTPHQKKRKLTIAQSQ